MGSAGHKAGSVGASWVCRRCGGRGSPTPACGEPLGRWPAPSALAGRSPRTPSAGQACPSPAAVNADRGARLHAGRGHPALAPAPLSSLALRVSALWAAVSVRELFSPLRVQAQSAALCHCGHFRFRDLRSPAELCAPSGAEVTLCRLLPARGAQARSHVLPLAASPESPRRLRAEGGRRPGDREALSEGIAEAEAASGAASLRDLGAGHPHRRIPCPPLGKLG